MISADLDFATRCISGYCYYNLTEDNNGTKYVDFMYPVPDCDEEPSDKIIASVSFKTCAYIFYSVIFIMALFGNSTVCYTVFKSPKLKTATNYFIVNLAVGDILMTILCIPFSFVSMLVLRYWPFGEVMCKVVNYSQAVSVLVSAYTLLALSIDRYMAIMKPLKQVLGKFGAKIIVGGVWAGAMVTAAPIAFVSKLQRPSPWHYTCSRYVCGERWESQESSVRYTFALLTLQFALPLAALVCTYARIAHVVWGGKPPGEANNARDQRIQQSKRKMIKMMIVVVMIFTLSWLPLNVLILFWTIHLDDYEWSTWPLLPYLWFASHWLAMSHSCCNPIIYCYMNKQYQRGFKRTVIHLLRLRNNAGQRSSLYDNGIPLSEVGVDRTMPRRVMGACQCQVYSTPENVDSEKCVTCGISSRRVKFLEPPTLRINKGAVTIS